MKITRDILINSAVFSLVGFLALVSGFWLTSINVLLTGSLLLFLAIGLYFYIVLSVCQKNWLDIRAIFSAIWFSTIGLAAFKLTAYQEVWQAKTWFLLGVAFFVFQVGAFLGIYCTDRLTNALATCFSNIKKVRFDFNANKLFWCCVFCSLIGLTCFVINVFIKGYIPCFSDSPFAYTNFYTKLHVFSVAATIACGPCYYCIKTQKLNLAKKIVLWCCIFYLLILFPTMIVSRGVFVSIALYFTSVVFYLNKQKFISLVLCLTIIFGVYMAVSEFRNFTNEQLTVLFEPKDFEENIASDNDKDENEDEDINEGENDSDNLNVPSFQLSPKMAFLYGYLTVGHDNFNEAVQNLDWYTWGSRTIKPFNVVLRIPALDELSKSSENYFVRPHLNTYNFLGEFFYDFHGFGVALLTFLFALVSALLQQLCVKFKNPFSIFAFSVFFQAVFLVFFSNMACRFEFWVFLGVIAIFALISSVKFVKTKN